MVYEVENKFSVEDAQTAVDRLEAMGTRFDSCEEQVDVYFAHPARDFAVTDEALRIRQIGEDLLITYKGPKIDAATKTRRELELPLGGAGQPVRPYCELLELLGFRRVVEVRKRRRGGDLPFADKLVRVAVDQVERLGAFVELEIGASQAELPEAQAALVNLASQLGLEQAERRSYLELLLASGDVA